MDRSTFLRGTAAGLLMAGGGAAARADSFVGAVTYKGWKNAYRLTNGTVDVVVVPSIGGRIMRYGLVFGKNLLWENPTVAGKLIPMGEWPNTGGDKVWPWPQDDWGKLQPKAWPPPPEADQIGQMAEVLKTDPKSHYPDTLRLTSAIMIPYGVRIVRTIRVAPTGTKVFLTSKFVQERDDRTVPCSPWSVTQVPAQPWVLARLLPEASQWESGYRTDGPAEFKAVTKMPEGVLKVERNSAKANKLFTEADMLASLNDDMLFTVRTNPTPPLDNVGRKYKPGDRAQIYCHLDDASFGGAPSYTELEMTAPLAVLKRGETITLDETWECRRVPESDRTPEGVARIIKGM